MLFDLISACFMHSSWVTAQSRATPLLATPQGNNSVFFFCCASHHRSSSLSPVLSPFRQYRHVQHLCTALSSRCTGRHLSAKTLTNRDRDERSHDSPSPHPAHTLSEDTDVSAEPRLAHWHSQCHLMFCLAVSTVRRALLLATWLGPEAWAQKGGGNKDGDKSSSTVAKPAAPNDVCLKLLCVCVCACAVHASAF